MKILLAHDFRARGPLAHLAEFDRGWVEGTLTQDGERFNVLNKEGNKLIQGATPGFLALLKSKNLIQEDDRS